MHTSSIVKRDLEVSESSDIEWNELCSKLIGANRDIKFEPTICISWNMQHKPYMKVSLFLFFAVVVNNLISMFSRVLLQVGTQQILV